MIRLQLAHRVNGVCVRSQFFLSQSHYYRKGWGSHVPSIWSLALRPKISPGHLLSTRRIIQRITHVLLSTPDNFMKDAPEPQTNVPSRLVSKIRENNSDQSLLCSAM